MTGLWQVSRRSDTSYQERAALDQHYVDWRQVTHQEALACLEKARE